MPTDLDAAREQGRRAPDQGEETERLAKVYADATGYYVPFHAGLKSESSDQIRAGIRAVLAALSPPNQGEEVRPFAEAWSLCEAKTPSHMPRVAELAKQVRSTDFRRARAIAEKGG